MRSDLRSRRVLDTELAGLTTRIAGPLFTRPEPRQAFADLVRALLADVSRKNSWQLADHIGHATAHCFEHLLDREKWDVDALRDEVRSYVIAHLGRADGVLIADDTAAIKKGEMSVGVADQHCGLTGQVENCQVMLMLTYASSAGHAFVNRRLYLPEAWTGDPQRRARAGVPSHVVFRTKPQLVIDMLTEELAAGTKGLRIYDWTAVSVAVSGPAPAPEYAHTLLIRRSVTAPLEVEFFLAHAPTGTSVSELIDAAGMRWKIEENNEHGKDLPGLTSYQVRKWTPWHRHVTIAMLALAFLAATRAALPTDETAGEGKDRLLLEAPAP
nr:transposase [Planomonospora sphaerica]